MRILRKNSCRPRIKRKVPDFSFESQTMGFVAGVDEVGRGPLAGPVIAAACVFKSYNVPSSILDQIQDSKKLSPKRRAKAMIDLMPFVHIAWGGASVVEIDRLNIHHATLLAMTRALNHLKIPPQAALIDGKFPPKLSIPATCLIKGDDRSLSIAAASIFAKVTRDKIMTILHNRYPGYGWASNAGYGSKQHLVGIQELGITPHHRRSFSPISLCIK